LITLNPGAEPAKAAPASRSASPAAKTLRKQFFLSVIFLSP
jgi:hypothetical protein